MNNKRNEFVSDPIKLSRHITIGPQPTEESLRELEAKGFKTVINLANKGEHRLELSPEDEENFAKEIGIDYHHFPVSMANMKSQQAKEFCELVAASEKPVYIHCRLGQRSGPFALIYHALRRKLSYDKVLEKKDKLGLSWQAPMLDTFIKSTLKEVAESPS